MGFAERDGVTDGIGHRHPLDLQPDRPHEVQHLDDDGVGHLGFLDDVAKDGLRIGRIGKLPLQQSRHHLDAGQRVLHLVRDGRRHLAEGREPVAQPLPFLELLDPCQVLEEQRGAGDLSAAVADLRQGIADDLAGALQAELGAVGQVRELEAG